MDTTSAGPERQLPESWPVTLSATDAMFLRGEADLATRQTGHFFYVLDSIPEWDRFFRVWERASRMLPPLHQRIISFGRARLPEWRDDPDLDLQFHIRRLAVPAPGSLREVMDFAQADGMEPHDPARPLWQATLLEGLDGARAALLLKFSHAWMDGNASVELARLVYETERDGDLAKPMPEQPVAGGAEATSSSPLGAVAQLPRTVARGGLSFAGSVGRLAGGVARHPGRALADGAALAASLRRLVGSVSAAPSPLLSGRSTRSRFDVLDVPLQDLRRATKAVGCTINDGYLAGIAGGLRRYHEQFGVHIEEMTIGMPISTRQEGDPVLGNQVSATMLTVPVGCADPVERLKRIREMVLAARAEPAMDVLASTTNILFYLPDWVFAPLGNMLKIDLSASQSVGLLEPRYVAGVQLVRAYGFGPKTGCAMFVGMQSHLDQCCIGVHSDPAAVTDPELFMDCLRQGFDEVLSVGTTTPTKPTAKPTANGEVARTGTTV